MKKIFLFLITITQLSCFAEYGFEYREILQSIYDTPYRKRPEEMDDEEFDQFCEDAKNMPGNGYRDSKDAAKEVPEYEGVSEHENEIYNED